MKKSTFAFLLIIVILVLDQWLKIWIKTTMHLGEEYNLLGLSWAKIHFIENPGMAFGMTFGGDIGKLLLSVFRIIMVGFLLYYLRALLRIKVGWGIITGVSLILAGAIGNIIDSAFYGLVFSSTFHGGGIAEYVGFGNGYGAFLHGKVVDMFFFPMFRGVYAEWIPFLGGRSYLLFRPVFNIADIAITIGIFYMLIFHRHFISGKTIQKRPPIIINPITEETEEENLQK